MRCGTLLLLLSVALWGQQTRDLQFEPEQPANPLKDKGTRWAVVVGISNYQLVPPGAQLRFAHRDAEEFAGFLRTIPGGALPASHIRLLTNERATLSAVRAALHTWLVQAAGPEDIVYVFFAGHGVVAEHDEAYFVANDSDPQNLHATALSFREVDDTLSKRLRANLVMLVADACHTGRLGWTTYTPEAPSRASEPLAAIGQGDRSFLRLLAARSSERSFEDERWNGGHGVFTHTLLEGLRGGADRDRDQVIRAAELIDYVARLVPEQTESKQHPRVAGNFDARLPLALAPQSVIAAARTVALDVSGPASSAVYMDNAFRGKIREGGALRIESLAPGPHRFSADLLDGTTLEGIVTVGAGPARLQLSAPVAGPLSQLRMRVQAGQILEPNGAWDIYRNQTFSGTQKAAAAAMLGDALEDLGQACVQDYVQSTAPGPKGTMLRRAVEAYERLHVLRPNDSGIETRISFCRGRLQIAEGQFSAAVTSLEDALRRDPQFACAQNALGVALGRLNRPVEARRAFEAAARLTPEWALPPFQIAQQLIAAGELKQALPYLEKAVQYNPRSVGTRWSLLRANRLLGHSGEAERVGAELIRLNPNYAPAYMELGQVYETAGNLAKAAEAYSTYLLLAPNFADSGEVRSRAERIRNQSSRPVPTLRRK